MTPPIEPSDIDAREIIRRYIFGNRYLNRGAAEFVRRSQKAGSWQVFPAAGSDEFACDLRVLLHYGWLLETPEGAAATDGFIRRCREKAPAGRRT